MELSYEGVESLSQSVSCGSEPFREMSGSMKWRLKSLRASRGVSPSPLAPRRTSGPMKANQISPIIPILGRKRAAGLRGWFSRKSSTSSFTTGGSSSISSEVTLRETGVRRALDLEDPKRVVGRALRPPNRGAPCDSHHPGKRGDCPTIA
jgi:hypothetical protein